MKIYFEDGQLKPPTSLEIHVDLYIDACNGYSFCEDKFEVTKAFHCNKTIYTNSLVGLTSQYAWNENLGVHEIYMRDEETQEFTRIDNLTTRLLRQGHNIMKMFMAGEFHNK